MPRDIASWWSRVNGDVRGAEFDIAFDCNRVLVWPVDPVSVRALGVIPYPVRFDSARVQLRACSEVDPDCLSPFGDAGEVWFSVV